MIFAYFQITETQYLACEQQTHFRSSRLSLLLLPRRDRLHNIKHTDEPLTSIVTQTSKVTDAQKTH